MTKEIKWLDSIKANEDNYYKKRNIGYEGYFGGGYSVTINNLIGYTPYVIIDEEPRPEDYGEYERINEDLEGEDND